MKLAFIILSSVITIFADIPYIRDILKGTTKPNIVSWITWTLLTGIASAAQISAHEYVAAIFTGSATIATSIIVLLGVKHGFVKYTSFDVVCQIAAVTGIVLWQLFNSPALGVVAAVTIDFVGAMPTIRHSWRRPEQETWQTFALAGAAAILALGALSHYNWITLPYPVYLVIINPFIAIIISLRRKKARA